MSQRVGTYSGKVTFYRDLIHITVSDIKSEWISHQVSRNNNRKNDTGLTGTTHYDIIPRITVLQTVLLHSKHCKYELRILKYITFFRHIRTRFVTILHIITTQ